MSRGRETVLVIASHVPLILLRLARVGLGLLVQKRRGRNTFRRTLRDEGVGRDVARRLARNYAAGLSLRRLVRWSSQEVR